MPAPFVISTTDPCSQALAPVLVLSCPAAAHAHAAEDKSIMAGDGGRSRVRGHQLRALSVLT